MKKLTIFLFSLFVTTANAEIPLSFFAGKYDVIGKTIEQGTPYTGTITITEKNDTLEMTRNIEGQKPLTIPLSIKKKINGTSQLTATWPKPDDQSMACLYLIDLDNYARVTCLLGKEGMTHEDKLGLEAWFPSHKGAKS